MTAVPEGPWFTVAAGVAVEVDPMYDGRLYVATLPNGPLLCLEDTAALIWREAIAAQPSAVAARVAAAVGLAVDQVEHDVEQFLNDLVDRGLLIENDNRAER